MVVLRRREDHSVHHELQRQCGPCIGEVRKDGRARQPRHVRDARFQGPGQELPRFGLAPGVRGGGELPEVWRGPHAGSGWGGTAEEQR